MIIFWLVSERTYH